jgi:hypothetical protein
VQRAPERLGRCCVDCAGQQREDDKRAHDFKFSFQFELR